MLVVVNTTMYAYYNITDPVPGIYMYYDSCMGHACMHAKRYGTTGVPELPDSLLLYFVSMARSRMH